MPTRRDCLAAGAGTVCTLLALPSARAAEPALADAIRAWAGSAVPRDGRVVLDIAPLVENGNAVPVSVSVRSPMTAADHVREVAIFNERNPQRDVLRFALSPLNGALDGRVRVATRIRLATSQQLVALARLNDGSVWQQRVDVIVTLAACIE